MKNNRVCLTCGTPYSYCISCPTSTKEPAWRNAWDTENCKNIFQTVSDYAQSVISKDKALEKLSTCDLTNVESFKDSIQKYIVELTTANEPIITTTHVVAEVNNIDNEESKEVAETEKPAVKKAPAKAKYVQRKTTGVKKVSS